MGVREHIDVPKPRFFHYEWVVPVMNKFLNWFHVHLYLNLKKQSYHFLRL